MAKPITLTEEYIAYLQEEFKKSLSSLKLSEGKINYQKKLEYEEEAKATISFDPGAFAKMLSIIYGFDSEVAWHGVVERMSPNEFKIRDILVYPQEVSGTTVDTDQEAYQTWLMELEDDIANSLRMQGHSHVNMGVTPSSVDLNHQEQILSQLNRGYYIFMIWNKKMDRTIKIFDMDANILYENDDVTVVVGDGDAMEGFLAEAKKVVKTRSYTASKTSCPGYAYGYGGSGFLRDEDDEDDGYDTTAKKTVKKKKPGRPPKAKANKADTTQSRIASSPGYYGSMLDQYRLDGTPRTDYDAMIFGERRY